MLQHWPARERQDAVLDACIDQLDVLPPERLLLRYPQSATTLAPLLEVARSLRDLGDLELAPAARLAMRARLRQAVRAQQRRERRRLRRVWSLALACLLLLALALGGVTTVAADALPGDRLYGWKRASEEVWWHAQPTPARRVSVALRLADRRVAELVQTLDRQRALDGGLAVGLEQSYRRALESIAALPPAEQTLLLSRLHADGAAHTRALAARAGQASPAERPALDTVLALARWASTAQPGVVPARATPVPSPVPTPTPLPGRHESRDAELPSPPPAPRLTQPAAPTPLVAPPERVKQPARADKPQPPEQAKQPARADKPQPPEQAKQPPQADKPQPPEQVKQPPKADKPPPPDRPKAVPPGQQRKDRPSPAPGPSRQRGNGGGKGRDR